MTARSSISDDELLSSVRNRLAEGEGVGGRPATRTEPDQELVHRAQGGDEKAFAALYRRYAHYLSGLAWRLLGDTSELDDVVQETFVELLDSMHRLKDPAKVRGFLITIAVRRVHRRLLARRRRLWLGAQIEHDLPELSFAQRLRIEALYQGLDRMSPKLRIPWLLHRLEEQSLAEVASECGVSLATVKRRVAAADELLKRRLTHG